VPNLRLHKGFVGVIAWARPVIRRPANKLVQTGIIQVSGRKDVNTPLKMDERLGLRGERDSLCMPTVEQRSDTDRVACCPGVNTICIHKSKVAPEEFTGSGKSILLNNGQDHLAVGEALKSTKFKIVVDFSVGHDPLAIVLNWLKTL
jgi:hypothetical protein